ncbi:heat shock factor family protein, partial [Skeletonema marinoi]
MKKRTVTAAYASAAVWFPSESATKDKEDMYIKKADAATPPTQAAGAAAAPEGLDLLFAASQSQAEANLKDKESDASGAGAGDGATVPSTITAVSNEPVVGDDEYRDNEPENLATAALKNQEQSFPQDLHEILVIPECQSIVHWLPDGLSFIIADKQRFSSEILPKYFREALLNSFIRKLNRWGFRRVKSRRKGEESSFAHSSFVRDKPWMCLRMKCKSKPTYHKV